jgi:hypothetical protein
LALNRYLADPQWRRTFEQLRATTHEAAALEARLLDEDTPEEGWTAVWAEYAGLLGRVGFLQQRLLARRIELLG